MIHATRRWSSAGFTLVEVVISAALLAIVFLGTVQYFTASQWEMDKGARSQMGWISMSSQLERALNIGYDALLDSLPETSLSLTLNRIQGYRTTVVAPVDDPLDGLAPSDIDVPDYLKVSVYFAWFIPGNVTDSVSVYFTPQRSIRY